MHDPRAAETDPSALGVFAAWLSGCPRIAGPLQPRVRPHRDGSLSQIVSHAVFPMTRPSRSSIIM